ncbi:toll-like receptor 5 [Pseudochaenichthys georgianus]|uniref:toll-like receptor 5 n=1 Tax=Pseudochaenichthys georgianus TaxID=52239 RepID=UPI00146D771A|nr:toll-like receptor 5 [Pseudochaenichthys georgianus]
MWTLGLQVVVICVFLQVPGCFPSCLIIGSVANCASKNLRWVPPLPPHITHLFLEMNHISEMNSSSLSGLEQLQELDLGRQYVPLVIRNNSFSGQSRLRRLVLGFNIGLQLEPQAFIGLSGLQNLHLDYCSLQDTILKETFLEPLSSLQSLDLFGNQIKTLQPAMFFANMTHLNVFNLKLNKIDRICESDLVGFQGKNFEFLNLGSVHLKAMLNERFDWQKCGNPFRGMSFQTLDLSNNGFSVGKSKHFFSAIKGTKISHLIMSGHMGKGFSFNNLPDPDRSTFQGLNESSIRTLDLSKNRIFALQQGVFSPLKEVTIIDVSQNRVNQIHRNSFEGLQGNVKMLNLSHNLLGEIHSHTFASLTNLEVLDLSYNHIGALGYGAFSGLPKLKALYLTGNSLRDLGFPASLPSLDYLLLKDNKLTSMSSIARVSGNVVHLNIQDNRLTNLGDVHMLFTQLKRLKHLLYGGNTIRRCTVSGRASAIGLNEVQVLDLHSSSLQAVWSQGRCLNLFDNLGHMIGVDLRLNTLKSLPQGIFKGLTSVVEIDLSSNSLTYLHNDVLPKSLKILNLSNNFVASPDPAAFRFLSFLDLNMNRFHCDSNLKSFLSWLNKTNVTFLSPVEDLRCEYPSGFYKVPLLDYSTQLTQQ